VGLLVKTEPTMTAEALAETRVEVKRGSVWGFFVFTIKRLEKWKIKNRNHSLYLFSIAYDSRTDNSDFGEGIAIGTAPDFDICACRVYGNANGAESETSW
jgi:hypothetical protein